MRCLSELLLKCCRSQWTLALLDFCGVSLFLFFFEVAKSSGIQNQINRLPRQFFLNEANVLKKYQILIKKISIKARKSKDQVMTFVFFLSPLKLRQSAKTICNTGSLLRRDFLSTFACLHSCSLLKVITHWTSKETFMLSPQNSPNSAWTLTFPLFCTFSWRSFDVMTNEWSDISVSCYYTFHSLVCEFIFIFIF